jgi:hypothetical protein
MNRQTSQQKPDPTSALAAAFPVNQPRPVILTVKQFSARNPAWTPPALRNLIFKAKPRQSSKGEIPGNGLLECGAVFWLDGRVLLNELKLLAWAERGGRPE